MAYSDISTNVESTDSIKTSQRLFAYRRNNDLSDLSDLSSSFAFDSVDTTRHAQHILSVILKMLPLAL